MKNEHAMCAACDQGELVREARDVSFAYKGYTTVIKSVRGEWCSHCGEGFFGAKDDDGDRMAEEMHAFVMTIDARTRRGK